MRRLAQREWGGGNAKTFTECPQSVVSAVLFGKRTIDLRQAKALAMRFHLPMDKKSAVALR